MLRFKSMILIFGIVLLVSLSFAQGIGSLGSSIATADNLFAPISNPALVGTQNPRGIGWVHAYDDEEFLDHYWLVTNMDGLSYVYENDDGTNYHSFALGSELFDPHIFRNFYAGTSYTWKNNKTNEGAYRTGFAYRPFNFASLAMTFDNPYKQSPQYKVGLGIRPLGLIKTLPDYRTEFTVDMDYNKNGGADYEMLKPTFGVNSQIFDGIKLGASYNSETETPMFSFSISARKSEIGSVMSSKDDVTSGLAYIHLTDQSFKPFMGITPQSWYKMKLNGQVVTYRSPKYKIGPFSLFESNTKSIEDIIKELNKAKKDPRIHGILLQNPSFSASYSVMQELITAVGEFKASGKKIAIYYDNISNGGYIFASAIADKIYLNPNGGLDLKGFSVNSPYIKDMLDAIGIEVLNFRSHAFKTAGNMFSESEMTDAERLVYTELLGSIYDQAVNMIGSGRGEKLSKPVSELIDNGPYWLASDALEAGLIDEIIYADELDKKLKENFGFSNKISEMEDYREESWAKPLETQIAVIYAQGNIVMGKGNPGQKIAQETTVDLIRKARKNPAYKGIILRIDSGGGSAHASDVIWRELELAKTENKKKIVVSMSGVAASGGYYIACNADKIVANPGTITGSIGVVGMAFNAEKLFKKVKVNWSTVKKGERSDFGSMNRAWREDEKEIMTKLIEHSYEDFTGKVAKGRNMPIERIHELAQGRVWTGQQAFDSGLVDVLGGFDEAVRQMRILTGIKGKIRLVDATTDQNGIKIEMETDPLSLIVPSELMQSLGMEYKKASDLWSDYASDPILMLSPITSGEDIN